MVIYKKGFPLLNQNSKDNIEEIKHCKVEQNEKKKPY